MKLFLSALLLATLPFCSPANATDCPTDKPCKVVIVSPEQEVMLDQLISSTCVQGPYAQIAELVKFYKEMLAKAPAGTPAKAADAPKK